MGILSVARKSNKAVFSLCLITLIISWPLEFTSWPIAGTSNPSQATTAVANLIFQYKPWELSFWLAAPLFCSVLDLFPINGRRTGDTRLPDFGALRHQRSMLYILFCITAAQMSFLLVLEIVQCCSVQLYMNIINNSNQLYILMLHLLCCHANSYTDLSFLAHVHQNYFLLIAADWCEVLILNLKDLYFPIKQNRNV